VSAQTSVGGFVALILSSGCAPAPAEAPPIVVSVPSALAAPEAVENEAPVDVSKAVVGASFVTRSGDGFWGDVGTTDGSQSAWVRPCYEAALRRNPKIAGWFVVDVVLVNHEARVVAGSPLPQYLEDCVVARLRALDVDPGMYAVPTSLYVSLSPQ